ncbi:MAG: PAS domain S-box protein [Chloroflexi bacterium]|nr:PAS domain S-box protein [Chloroflexota bacterium]
MKLHHLKTFLFGTLRGRLVISVAFIHAVMMTLFIVDLTARQHMMLLENQTEAAIATSNSLATSAAVWIASNDLSGLQELVEIERRYPEMSFAILTDESGLILAHTDKSKVGLYLLDLPQELQQTVLGRSAELVDVAVPAMLGDKHVGWARVGLGQEAAAEKLAGITNAGILYAFAAIFIGSVIAWNMGTRITKRLYAVQDTIGEVRNGVRTARAIVRGTDEAASIAHEFNSMLDALDERDEALRKSSEEIQDLYNHAPCGYHSLDSQGVFVRINNTELQWIGHTREEVVGRMKFTDFISGYSLQTFEENFPLFKKQGWIKDLEFEIVQKDGIILPVLLSSTAIYDEAGNYLMSRATLYDIAERKQAENALRERERHSQSLLRISKNLEQAQTYTEVLEACRIEVQNMIGYQSLWVYLISEDKKYFKSLVAGGDMTDIVMSDEGTATLTIQGDRMLEEIAAARDIVVVEDAQFDERTNKEIVAQLGNHTIVNVPIFLFDRHLGTVGMGTFGDEGVRVPSESEQEYLKSMASHLAVSLDRIHLLNKRKQMEKDLITREREYRVLLENIPDLIVRYNTDLRRIYVNPAWERASGLSAEEVVNLPPSEIPRVPNPVNEEYAKKLRDALTIGAVQSIEFTWENACGATLFLEYVIVPELDQNGNINGVLSVGRDITERKRHELEHNAIITVSAALRQVNTRAELLNVILDQLEKLFEADGVVLALPSTQNSELIDTMGRGIIGERTKGLIIPPGKGVCNWVIQNQKPYLTSHAESDSLFYRPELLGDSHCLAAAPLVTQEQAIGALWIARRKELTEHDLHLLTAIADIAASAIQRAILNEQIEQQLNHLLALHEIDIAITANLNLETTLNIILKHVKEELIVDAVSILLLNPLNHTLDYKCGIGFKTRSIEKSSFKLEEDLAGRAVLDYQTASCPDLRLAGGKFSRSSLLATEEFISYHAAPLVVKGQVKGVLEIFNRKQLKSEQGWLDYFETLATQTAIAVENASLLENLQKSNQDLLLAYDATIEGWSRALDLRDKETEGHSQRVTEMALKLAEKIGMSETEQTDLRRGALLHDIGKMGVPDAILHKTGTLAEAEWEIMRQHPTFAYQMLSPITYLKHALEISYYHHEKWDGTGYPHGLKGEEIPLAARVFAVVDVFDALTSDRPYRKAWSDEDAYHYIETQAGKHFDPQIVKIFLESQNI